MVMRTMRENTKWIMLILTFAFVGWLVFDWVQGGGGMQQGAGANPVVGTVNGEEIRYTEWNRFRQSQMNQARQQAEGSLTDQQMHRLEEQAWNQLVNRRLIQQELARLGLEATAAEIRQAFRSPSMVPPSLRGHPAFQTDGQFDFQKYQDFFSDPSVDEQLLLQIESYLRETIPRAKLYRLVSEEVTLTERELWRYYRDRNERARVRYAAADPAAAVADSAVAVSAEQVRAYYREHRDEFTRPPTAVVDLVSLTAQPSAEDSARARSTLDSLRSAVAEGEQSFAALVEQASAGELGDVQGGQIGPVGRGDLIAPLEKAVFSLPVREVSDPVRSPSGFHVVQVVSRGGEDATFRHLLVPVRLSPEGEDALYDQMDRLEGIALDSDLAAAADSLGLELRDDLELTEGSQFVPGAGPLGVAVAWAFDSETLVGDLSRYFENASGFHILELEERLEGTARPLDEVRGEIRSRLTREAKRAELHRRMREAAAEPGSDLTLRELAARRGWDYGETSWFTRTGFVEGLGRNTEAVGAAFGLEEGRVAGPARAGGRLALVQLVEREPASREAFESQKRQLRAQLASQRRQSHLDRWLQALREKADIQDMRDQLGTSRGGAARAAS